MQESAVLVIAIVAILIVLLAAFSVGWGGHRSQHAETRGEPDQQFRRVRDEGHHRAKVLRVIDGDTAVVSRSGDSITIRLSAIDCPENGQHWGDIAKYGLIKLIGGREIRMEDHGQDCYGRTIATIYVWHGLQSRWINVNERMVVLGHAWVMRKFYGHLPREQRDQLNRMEYWARSRKVGLWRSDNPVPPWKWRREGLQEEKI